MTREEAEALIGSPHKSGGKIIGVCGKPGRKYLDGIYVIVVYPNKSAQYFKVGEEPKLKGSNVQVSLGKGPTT